jgi:hypothetical protein
MVRERPRSLWAVASSIHANSGATRLDPPQGLIGRTIRAARGGATPREMMWRTIAVLGFRRLWVFLETPGPRTELCPSDIEARTLLASEVDEYCSVHPQTPPAEVCRRLNAGHSCVALWRNERIVASRWLSRERAEVEYLGLTVELPAGIEYHYDSHTVPEERRMRRQTLLREITFEIELAAGCTEVLFAVLPENRARLASLQPSAQRVGTLASVGMGPRRIPIMRGEANHLRGASAAWVIRTQRASERAIKPRDAR